MFPFARNGGFSTRFYKKIHQSAALLRISAAFSATTAESSFQDTAARPPPIRVALTDSAGRGVFATRKIASGDLIHTARPVVSHPSLAMVHSVCYFCLKRLSNTGTELRSAPNVSYCSDQCKEHSKVPPFCFPLLSRVASASSVVLLIDDDLRVFFFPQINAQQLFEVLPSRMQFTWILRMSNACLIYLWSFIGLGILWSGGPGRLVSSWRILPVWKFLLTYSLAYIPFTVHLWHFIWYEWKFCQKHLCMFDLMILNPSSLPIIY